MGTLDSMSNQPTQYTEQNILNYSTDNLVSPPLLTIGMMYWNGSEWTRFTNTTLDSTYLRLDCANSPLTGNLEILKSSPQFKITDVIEEISFTITNTGAVVLLTDSAHQIELDFYQNLSIYAANRSRESGAILNLVGGNTDDTESFINGFVRTGFSAEFGTISMGAATTMAAGQNDNFIVGGNFKVSGYSQFNSGVMLAAGTTSSAGLHLQSGPLQTFPTKGALEFLTDTLYITITTGTARKAIAIQDSSPTFSVITANAASNQLVLDSGTNAVTFNSGSSGSAKTITTPNVTGTLASLGNLSQTFLGSMSFSNTILAANTTKPITMNSSGGGSGGFVMPSIVSSVSYTLPNGTATLATLGLTETFTGAKTFATNNITIANVDVVLGTTTGTKFGTSTSQKLSFYNATPIVQITTGVAASTFVANTSGIADDTATWDGYTIGQVVKALRNLGLFA